MNDYYEYEYYPMCHTCERDIDSCFCSEFDVAILEGWPNRKTEHSDLLPMDYHNMTMEIWFFDPDNHNSENYISLQLHEKYVHIITEKPPDYFVFAMLVRPTFTLFSYRAQNDFLEFIKFKVREA